MGNYKLTFKDFFHFGMKEVKLKNKELYILNENQTYSI